MNRQKSLRLKSNRMSKIYNDDTLQLSRYAPFAEGGNRLCYVHPDDRALCIKIVKEGSIAAFRARRSFIRNLRGDAYFDDNVQEYRAYQQAAIRNNAPQIYEHIPKCYGWQNTDMGMGLVLDYYAYEDGSTCINLEAYLHENGLTDDIKAKVDELADFLRTTQILTKNILPHNVVIAADGKLKIIDGLGFSSDFNVIRVSKLARRASIERRVRRMYLRLDWEVSAKNKSWLSTEKDAERP